MTKPKRPLKDRIQEADVRSGTYLADANEAGERGDRVLEERLLAKCQFWLDRYNRLVGNA